MIDRWTILKNEKAHAELELKYEQNQPVYWFHCQIYKWSHNLFREYVDIMFDIQDQMKESGVKYLFAVVKDKKLERFAEMFGWDYLIDTHEGKVYYMEADNG